MKLTLDTLSAPNLIREFGCTYSILVVIPCVLAIYLAFSFSAPISLHLHRSIEQMKSRIMYTGFALLVFCKRHFFYFKDFISALSPVVLVSLMCLCTWIAIGGKYEL